MGHRSIVLGWKKTWGHSEAAPVERNWNFHCRNGGEAQRPRAKATDFFLRMWGTLQIGGLLQTGEDTVLGLRS